MRVKISKAIKVALACALVFLVAAPLIVGVYDAARGNISANSEDDATKISEGTIEIYSRATESNSGLPNVREVFENAGRFQQDSGNNQSGLRSGEGTIRGGISDGYTTISEEVLREDAGDGSSVYGDVSLDEDTLSVADWYSGDTRLGDLFRSGAAHIVYDFPDGSTVDFGNPYILDWTDVPPPDDYAEVMALADDGGGSSIFAPEKAYASPVSFVVNKLRYLMLKTGVWFELKKGTLALMCVGAEALGYEAPMVMETAAKIEAEMPAIAEVFMKEGAVASEEDLFMALSDGIWTLSQEGLTIAEFPAVMQREAQSIAATGELLGGGSSNFMNAMYQFFATNQVTAEFIASNADFFTTFFSWLGADLTQFDDYPRPATNDSESFRFDGYDLTLPPITFDSVSVDMGGWLVNHGYTFEYAGTTYFSMNPLTFYVNDASGDLYLNSSDKDKVFYDRMWNGDRWVSSSGVVPNQPVSDFSSFVSGGNVFVTDECKYFDSAAVGKYSFEVYDYAVGQWDLTRGSVVDISGDQVSPTLVGSGAQYDDAGNITDYGNVTVPNVFAPDYVAPGSYAEALNQMNATATTDQHATAESPAFGQAEGTTVKDWTEANKPSEPDPGAPSSKDDFKVEDLEKVFPFCVPWDLYYLLSALAAEPEAPNVVWTFDFADLGKHELPIDLSPFESVAQVVRVGEVLAFCVGLALVTRDLVRG